MSLPCPDNDGIADILEIIYTFEKSGYAANIFVYNANGILMKNLLKTNC